MSEKKATTRKPNELKEDDVFVIPGLDIRITPSWIRLIRFVQTDLRHGQICIKITNAQPATLVDEHTKRSIRFDKEEQISDFGDVKF